MTDEQLAEKYFGGDSRLLQERLRRYCQLRGLEIYNQFIGVSAIMTEDVTLQIFTNPVMDGTRLWFGRAIYHDGRIVRRRSYYDINDAQYLYEKLGKAIKELEENIDNRL